MRYGLLAFAWASLCGIVHAESLPVGLRADARIKEVAYNADDVVKVVGHYGYSTDIVFSSNEEVQNLAAGDAVAWEIAPVGNHLFVKPRESNAVTNMTVVTNRHTYEFSLDAREVKGLTHSGDAGIFFQVRFRYPQDEAIATQMLADAKRKELEAARVQAVLDTAPVPGNWNYWACGAKGLWPTEVYDDGRFTYMRFPDAQELPAIFMINTDGSESLANGGMRGDQYVVQLTARKFVLRKGLAVACVANRSYSPWGVGTPNGTINPNLQRKIRAAAPRTEDVPGAPANVKTAATNGFLLPRTMQSTNANSAIAPIIAAPSLPPPSAPRSQEGN